MPTPSIDPAKLQQFRQMQIDKGIPVEQVDAFIAKQTGGGAAGLGAVNLKTAPPAQGIGVPQQKEQAAATADQTAKRNDTASWEKRGAQAALMGASMGAGMLATPAAFVGTVGPQLAPFASTLTNAAVSAATSAGLDLINGEYRSIDELVRNAASAGAIDAAVSLAQPAIGRWVSKGLFSATPGQKTLRSVRAEAAQDILAANNSSLNVGAMEGRSSGKASFVESYLAASMFTSGGYKDKQAADAAIVENAYKRFMDDVGAKTDRVVFGDMLQSILVGEYENYGTKLIPKGFSEWDTTTRQGLYRAAESFYEGKGITVPYDEVEPLLQQLAKFKDTAEIGPAYGIVQSYIPAPVEDPVTKKLIQPDVPLESLILAKREINERIGKTGRDVGAFKGLSGAVGRTNEVIHQALADIDPKALTAYTLADAFTGTSAAVKFKTFASQAIDKLKESPETLAPFLADPKTMPSKLKQLENLWSFANEGFHGKVKSATLPDFEEVVKKPLRYYILNDAFDPGTKVFNEQKAWTIYNRYPPEIKAALFGPDHQEQWTKIVNAGKYLMDQKYIDRVVPRLLESGLVMTATYQAAAGDMDQANKALMSLAAIGVVTHGLAAVMRNPKMARGILMDFASGPTSGKFMQGLFNLEAQAVNEALKTQRRNPSAANFYRDYPKNRTEAKQQAQQQQAMQNVAGGLSSMADMGVGP